MNRTILKSFFIFSFLFTTYSCQKSDDDYIEVISKETNSFETSIATKWIDLQLKLIKTTPNHTPPINARNLGYSGLTLYESFVNGMPHYRSMNYQLNGFNNPPIINKDLEYNWAMVANTAMSIMLKKLYSNTSTANIQEIDLLNTQIKNANSVGVSTTIIYNSEMFGEQLANAIYEYSKTDGGHEAFNNNFPTSYNVPSGFGFWIPTNAVQSIPLLPFWGQVRFFATVNQNKNPIAHITFSTNVSSEFYMQALTVYDTSNNLTSDQTMIANFWADGSNTYTPPGHWMNIATQIIQKENASLSKAVETYAKLGMALNDAFIFCWKAKYQYNLMRPVTYIRQNINPSWSPLLATPPFPEYVSGHSSGSGAFAKVMTSLYGDNYLFTDKTYHGVYPDRTYTSFIDASNEAAISRLYGGIHYPMGNENGKINGMDIGQSIIDLNFYK
ncbi:vanadium-dependent haloperoxidase [Flavobacterium sp.]|jgi:hypothetical protein|uniref:vanadium-dependent haloperoxidase n=1 Tax=Flavobacterium sp. TaxID=239 RepID=UPI0037C04B2B